MHEKRGATTMATPHLLMCINYVEFENLYAWANNIGQVYAAEVMVDGVRFLNHQSEKWSMWLSPLKT
jgi:hypothetical protein